MDTLLSYWPWLFLLLPVTYLLGWLKGRRYTRTDNNNDNESLSSDYFKGLNYLLADQQDKALPVFLQLVKVDHETIDTHLALATIYRRSGKLDKAIEVHQNLIARPSLSASYRSKALLELGRDYLAAGLFDRAEGLFNDVIKSGFYDKDARQYMLTISQQEKDWDKAIEMAKVLINQGDNALRPLIAQFYCEQSESLLSKSNIKAAELATKSALAYHPECIRAIIIKANIALKSRKFKDAIKLVKQVAQVDIEHFESVLTIAVESFKEISKTKDLIEYLIGLENQYPNLLLMDTIVSLLSEAGEEDKAQAYLQLQLAKNPNISGLSSYANLLYKQEQAADENALGHIQAALKQMKTHLSQYHCRKCGYTSGTMNWQCPSCHSWGEIKPMMSSINAKN